MMLREMDAEAAAVPDAALDRDFGAVADADCAHDGQSQPRTPFFAGTGFVDSEETVEHPGQCGGGYADARVEDFQHAAVSDTLDAQRYGAAGRSEPDGVAEKIDDDLLDACRLPAHRRRRGDDL